MVGTLEGIRVVDLTTVIMGPWAAQMMGDMGADVIKVETRGGDISRGMGPGRNKGMAACYLTSNRNKRSVVLDLTQDEGLSALRRLIGSADVFMHNFRPKVINKFNLGYETFKDANPELVYCGAYGFRADGPWANKPAYDDIIQTAAGYCDMQELISDQPRYVPSLIADKTSSYAVFSAILAALVCRERGGGGQAVEVPMFETMVDYAMIEHLYGATFDPPIAQMGYERIMNIERRPYQTSDGGYLTVLPYTDKNWVDFFKLAGREEFLDDPDFQTYSNRLNNSKKVYATLNEIVSTRTLNDWVAQLDAANIPAMMVKTKEDLLDDEQLNATGFWHSVDHPTEGKLRFTDPPFRYSKTPSTIRDMPPLLGEQSREILAEAGYSADEIDDLIAKNVTKAS